MIRSIPSDFLKVVRDSFRIWWLAPLIPLLVVVPEALQHIAEIRIGMFEGKAQAMAVANDPRRMIWGYLKIAGLVLAILAALRFWPAQGSTRRWWDPRGVAWASVGVGLGLIGLTIVPGLMVEAWLGSGAETAAAWIDGVLTVASLPLFVLLVAGLRGDRSASLAEVYRLGWLPALRGFLFAAVLWMPLQWLHTVNHRWAMGAADWQVWALMAFDSLVVGLLAVTAGTAIHHGGALLARERCKGLAQPT